MPRAVSIAARTVRAAPLVSAVCGVRSWAAGVAGVGAGGGSTGGGPTLSSAGLASVFFSVGLDLGAAGGGGPPGGGPPLHHLAPATPLRRPPPPTHPRRA